MWHSIADGFPKDKRLLLWVRRANLNDQRFGLGQFNSKFEFWQCELSHSISGDWYVSHWAEVEQPEITSETKWFK